MIYELDFGGRVEYIDLSSLVNMSHGFVNHMGHGGYFFRIHMRFFMMSDAVDLFYDVDQFDIEQFKDMRPRDPYEVELEVNEAVAEDMAKFVHAWREAKERSPIQVIRPEPMVMRGPDNYDWGNSNE